MLQAFKAALWEFGADAWALFTAVVTAELAARGGLPTGSGPVTRARQASTVITVVIIGIVALIGLLIFGEVYAAMPLDNEVFDTDGALDGAPEDILGGMTDAIGLVPIILLVLLASVVIGVVQRMRGR